MVPDSLSKKPIKKDIIRIKISLLRSTKCIVLRTRKTAVITSARKPSYFEKFFVLIYHIRELNLYEKPRV